MRGVVHARILTWAKYGLGASCEVGESKRFQQLEDETLKEMAKLVLAEGKQIHARVQILSAGLRRRHVSNGAYGHARTG